MKNWIRILGVFLAVLAAIPVFSQSTIDIKGTVSNQETGSGLGSVTVSLYRDGTLIETVTTASNGKYKFKKTDAKGIMTVKFSKGGYVGKFAEIDMNGIAEEDGGEFPLEVSPDLFEEVPNVDFSILDTQPVAKAGYDKGVDNIVWNEQYIEKKKKEIQKIIDKATAEKQKQADAQAALDKKFNDAVAAANSAMTKGDYSTAITKYNEALTVKDDADVKTKLKDAEEKKKVADANAEVDKNYTAQMAEAKKFFDAKDYASSKSKYEEASKTKPAEAAPKDKIKEIDNILKNQLEDENKYNKFLADGEKAMLAENYDEAIKQFTEAGKMRPAEQLPKDELKKAQDAKKKKEADALAEKKKKEDFDKLVTAGDASNTAKKYDEAIASYEKALALIDDAAVKTKRDAAKKAKEDAELAKKKEDEEKEKERLRREEFDKLMKKGGEEMTATEYDKAVGTFESALIVIANEPTAVAKLAEAKKKKDEKDLANKNKAKFDEIVARGDSELGKTEYDKAIASYKEALTIIKDDAGAKSKLADAEAKKNAHLKNKADFDKLVQEGDVAVTGKKYDDAIGKYEKALAIFQDAAVQTKLDKAKSDRDAANQAAEADKKKKDDFNALITKGDGEVKSSQFDDAIKSYEDALKIIPKEASAEAKLADAKAKKKAKEDADLAAKEKAAKQEQFDKLVAQGDTEMNASEFDKAITSYTAALAIIKDEPGAKAKLAEANKKKTELATNKANFDKLVKEGDDAVIGKKYDDAIGKYEKALAIIQDAGVQTKLDKAKADRDAALGAAEAEKKKKEEFDALVKKGDGEVKSTLYDDAIKSFEDALKLIPKEAGAEAKLADAKAKKKAKEDADLAAKDKAAKQAEFDKFMAQGDTEMSSLSYDKAIAAYTSALGIFKDDPTAKAKLADAQKKKNEADLALKDKAAREKELEEKYKKHYNEGMTQSNSGEFEKAITEFEAALVLKPGDKDATSALENARKKLEERKAELDAMYNQRIQLADKLFNEGNYAEAKGHYEKASKLHPTDEHPKNRIIECDTKIKEKEKNDALSAEKRKNYDAEKLKGDDAFKNSKWDEAIKHYELALTFLDEQYPKDQIEAAKTKKLNESNALEAEKKKKEEFDALVKKGDGEVKSTHYDDAIKSFEDALKLIPKEAGAEAKLADAKAKKKAKDDADLAAKDKAAKQAEFDKFIAQGDSEMSSQSYDKAIAAYTSALGIFKDDPTAKAKLADAQKKKNEADLALKDKAAKEKELQEKYLQHFNAGKTFSNGSEFEKAITEFEAALQVKPGDADATKELEIAKQRLEEYKAMKDKAYTDRVAMADKLFDEGKFEDAKAQYVKANSQRPNDEHPKNRIKECDKKLLEQGEMKKLREQYDAAMANGEKELTSKHYDKAIAFFEAAKIILPNEKLPDERIAEAKRLKEKDKNDSEFAEKKKRFDALMAEGQNSMNGSEFDNAIAKFEEALTIIPNEKTAEAALALAKKRKKEWEEEKEREIQRILEFANKEFAASNWKDALKYYEKYLKFKKDDPYATSQAEKCRKKIKESSVDNANAGNYDKLIKDGNKLFGDKKYSDARSKFVDALGIYPTMSYPQKKIDEIDKLLAELTQQQNDIKKQEAINKVNNEKKKGPDYGEKTIMSADEALGLLQAAKLDDEKGKYEKIQKQKDKISKDNQLASESSEINREENYTEIDEQKKLQKDYSTNTKVLDENTDDYRKKQEQLEYETRKWNGENKVDEANKAYVKAQYEERGMNQYEERIRIINSEDVTKDKEHLVSVNKTIDQEAANTRNENGKELIKKKDELNDRYSANGTKLIGENAKDIKSDHEMQNDFNKEQNERANTIREENSETIKDNHETFVKQNKVNQEKLMAENSDQVKNEFLNQHTTNQHIYSRADEIRNDNSEELNQRKDDFADQNKYNRDEILAGNSADVKKSFETQHTTNQELNGRAADTRNENGEFIKKQQDDFADQQKVNQKILLDGNNEQVKNDFLLQNETAKKIDAQSAEIRNENGKDLQDKKDLLAKNTNSASDRLLDENGEEVKSDFETQKKVNDELNAKAADIRNDNGEALTKQKDELKNTYDKGAKSQADKIKEKKAQQDAMVADQKKADAAASKNRWKNGQDLQNQKDQSMVYEKGEEGYKSSYTVDFPQGVTEEVYTRKDADGNVSEVTVRRIVVEGDYGNEYRKVVTKSGTYYFKNNRTITNQTWDMETAKK